jgi:tetratricopeptide (TPR) repeat protein
MDRPSPRGPYSIRETASLLGLTATQLRSCVRSGFVAPESGPGGELWFSFQDLVLLRTAKALLDARIPRRRIRIALENLHAQLPQGRSLTGVRISAQGHDVVARDAGEAWHPESGQAILDFDVADLAQEASALKPQRQAPRAIARRPPAADARPGPGSRSGSGAGTNPATAESMSPHPPESPQSPEDAAADLYEHAVDLEADQPTAAIAVYRQALDLAPDLGEAHLNVGRLLHETGDPAAAEAHYRRALAIRPADPLAAYNLGVALQDQQRLREAADAYDQALALDPRLADAHYNLSGIYEHLGDKPAAFRHLRTYSTLTNKGSSDRPD